VLGNHRRRGRHRHRRIEQVRVDLRAQPAFAELLTHRLPQVQRAIVVDAEIGEGVPPGSFSSGRSSSTWSNAMMVSASMSQPIRCVSPGMSVFSVTVMTSGTVHAITLVENRIMIPTV
jgi:hypothetical protein